jgi:hypothetical protein
MSENLLFADGQCACPAIRAYAIGLNERGPQWVRDIVQTLAPKMLETRTSVALQRVRLRVFAQAAIASAESVLSIFEKQRPNDPRPRGDLQVARALLEGKVATYTPLDDGDLNAGGVHARSSLRCGYLRSVRGEGRVCCP